MEGLACNVVILPSPKLSERAITLSQNLANKGTLFTLRDGAFYSHASIYMLQLKLTSLKVASEQLAEIAQRTSEFDLTATNYWQAKQFLDAAYDKPDVLSRLQNDVIAALNPIRDGMRAKDIERMNEATGLALENFQRYGWNTVGELYRPHLTLTRFAEDQDITNLDLPDIAEFSGTFSKIGLFEMGDNGTCVRKISEFNLGK